MLGGGRRHRVPSPTSRFVVERRRSPQVRAQRGAAAIGQPPSHACVAVVGGPDQAPCGGALACRESDLGHGDGRSTAPIPPFGPAGGVLHPLRRSVRRSSSPGARLNPVPGCHRRTYPEVRRPDMSERSEGNSQVSTVLVTGRHRAGHAHGDVGRSTTSDSSRASPRVAKSRCLADRTDQLPELHQEGAAGGQASTGSATSGTAGPSDSRADVSTVRSSQCHPRLTGRCRRPGQRRRHLHQPRHVSDPLCGRARPVRVVRVC